MRSTRKIRSLASASALLLLFGAQGARADSVGQVQTTKYFAPETVAMLKQRVTDVANGVPGATLGFKQGDTVSYIIQFTPIANNSNIGAGGYITDYIPAGTQVVGAWFVQPDGAGGFYQTSPPAPAQMANGFGNGGAGAFRAGWTTDAYTISTCTAAGRTLANCTGNLAQLYADTGIFYSNDPRTAVFADPGTDGRVQQWSAPTGNGYNICPTRGNQLVPLMGGVVTGCAAGGASTHNYWDAAMTSAFGTTAASITTLAGLPRSAGIVAIDTDGSMVPPFNAGSAVAGPDSGYQLDYSGNVGPWQRISYAGSMMGSNAFAATTNPATVMGTNTVLATPTFSGAGFPLPASTNAVRWAAGRLVVGTQNFVKISLLLTSPPPSVGLVNNSEVFGGDTSPESSSGAGGGAGFGNRDSAWVYHVPSVASNVSTLYILKEVICVYDATGTCVANNGANLPTTGTPATVGPKVRYRVSYINSNNGTQHNVTICDQLPKTAIAINFAAAVTQISATPNIGMPTSPAAAACGFGAGGTTFSYPTIPVIAGGGAGILEYDVQLPVLTAGTSIVNTAKAVSTEIPAGVTSYTPSNVVTSVAANLLIGKTVSSSTPSKGDTVTYTVSISNTGSIAANLTTLVDVLPGRASAVLANQIASRFNYVATGSVTVNGAPLSGVTAVGDAARDTGDDQQRNGDMDLPVRDHHPGRRANGGDVYCDRRQRAGDQHHALRHCVQQHGDHQLFDCLCGGAGRAEHGNLQNDRVDGARHPDCARAAGDQDHRLRVRPRGLHPRLLRGRQCDPGQRPVALQNRLYQSDHVCADHHPERYFASVDYGGGQSVCRERAGHPPRHAGAVG